MAKDVSRRSFADITLFIHPREYNEGFDTLYWHRKHDKRVKNGTVYVSRSDGPAWLGVSRPPHLVVEPVFHLGPRSMIPPGLHNSVKWKYSTLSQFTAFIFGPVWKYEHLRPYSVTGIAYATTELCTASAGAVLLRYPSTASAKQWLYIGEIYSPLLLGLSIFHSPTSTRLDIALPPGFDQIRKTITFTFTHIKPTHKTT